VQVKASQATSMLTQFIKAKLVPMLVGSPGSGKSQIVHQIAKQYGLRVIDLRLSQADPTDLLGFPQIKGSKAGYVPMETFPIEGDEIPKGYVGWLLFLDEFNSASPAVQSASYKLVLDRMVGTHHLHKNVAVICAGNLETDNAIVQPMSTALQSRLVHLELVVDAKEWNEWATSHGVDHRITSYIKFKPGNLYTFLPDHTDNTYACPRSWEFTDRLLKVSDIDDKDLLPMLAGTISEGVAREFLGFCKIYQNLPTMEQIQTNPEGIPVPDEPSVLFALTGSIAHNINTENATSLMKFVERLPVEFQVVTMKEAWRRNGAIKENAAVRAWVSKSASSFF
jgi:hypothetical protein